jgi:diguanylate cyclase (GGDEF)-like protein
MAYYEILKLVLRSIQQAVPSDRLTIHLLDENDNTAVREITVDSHSHFETGPTGRIPLKAGGGDDLSDLAFKRKETVVTTRGSGELPMAARVPMGASGRVIGVLTAERGSRSGAFGPEEVEVLLTFATQAGFVLENIRLHYELVQLAFKDELTGQYNHRFFIKRLREEVDRSLRYQHPFTVLLTGFDKFADFNDRYGYALGDLVLREWGRFLRRSHRACDLVARVGGDQFGIFLPETPPQGVQVVVEKILKAAETFGFTDDPSLKEIANRPTLSVGVVEFPTHGLMLEQLLESAHRAMDEAKSRGGNQAVFSSERAREAT